MIKVLFICHGNICRSPMAEFIFKNIAAEKDLADLFKIASAATSTEEIGNPVHYGTRNKLAQYGISTAGKYAARMKASDYGKYDYIIGMDNWNRKNILKITGGDPDRKVSLLMDFTETLGDVADPWYTGDFDKTYEDIAAGCKGLLEFILDKAE